MQINGFASAPWRSLPDKILESEIIFKGVLINKYIEAEHNNTQENINNKIDKSNQLIPQIFTIFVFKIDEILRGKYDKLTIEVMMLGGCDEESYNICAEYSFNYEYDINDEAVMFVNYHENGDYYQSSSGYSTAYTVEGSVEVLTTEGMINYIYEKETDKNHRPIKKDVLTLDILKNKIEELEAQ